MKTPIPITTSVPKRAKSQRKKALAAALATAQEYSEISWEQKKLQVGGPNLGREPPPLACWDQLWSCWVSVCVDICGSENSASMLPAGGAV